jgi:diguanylate cyclase (GGDEF)-like protein/PAS domain S-box-containing protein
MTAEDRTPSSAGFWARLAAQSADGAATRQLLLVGLLLMGFVVATLTWQSARVESDRLNHFKGELQHVAELIDVTLTRQLQNLDHGLLFLRAEALDHPEDLARSVELLRQDVSTGQEVHVTVLDHQGRVVLSDLPAHDGLQVLGERPAYKTFVAGGADQLHIEEPMLDPQTRRWILRLSRPVLGPDGSFQGIVELSLRPELLTRFMQGLTLASDTLVSVASSSGALLSRTVELERYRHAKLDELQLRALRQQTTGFLFAASPLDQVERGTVHRWLASFPLLLLVSREPVLMRAEIKSVRQNLLQIGLLAALLVVGSLAALARSLQQRQQIAARLHEAHHRMLEAQRIACLGSWELDPETRLLHLSEEAFRIFELDPQTPAVEIYQRALDRIHPEDRAVATSAYRQALRSEGAYDFNHRLLLPLAGECWVHARGRVSFDARGKAISLAGTVQDISARRREEAEREALNRDKLLLLDSTGEGIYGIDTTGHCTFINQAGAHMLGYRVEELIGRDIHELIHHHRADGSPYPSAQCPVVLATLSGESCRRDDEVFWHRNGQAIAVEYAAHPVRDGELVSGTVVTFSDISARKRAELELRIAEAAFQTQEGMFVTDAEGCILRVNRAFTEITGYTAAEIVGKNPRERSSGRQDAAFYAAMWERIRATGAWKGELWNRRKNGEIYPESITITAVMGDSKHVTHYVATMHDISERKAAEEKIRSLAFFDALTQLPNRRLLMDRLHQAQTSSARSKSFAGLMFIDLDRFKQLNDTHGHDKGDLLLQQVAQRLQGCVREADTVARLGGDEFVVLVESLSVDTGEAVGQLTRLGQKMLAALNEPYDLAGLVHSSTPSMGLTLFSGQAVSGEDLIKQADLAMYQSKAAGRNQLRLFDAGAGPAAAERLTETPG